jgi:hypothetical protein
MSQVTVQLVQPIGSSNISLTITDSGYLPETFNVSSNGINTTSTSTSTSGAITTNYNAKIMVASINNGKSNYNYTNTIISQPNLIYTTSYFTTTTSEFSSITFTPSDTDGFINTNEEIIQGDYTNNQTGYNNPFAANYLQVVSPTSDPNTYYNFIYINSYNNTSQVIGQIIYNHSQNTYTAQSTISLYNYQNLVLLANKSIAHYTNYPGPSDPITPLIFDAMFEMNSYAFNRLLNYI